jgi:hypothetical protein
MTRRMCAILLMVVVTTSCWNPFRPSLTGSATWTVGGQQYNASSDGFGALDSGSSVSIVAGNCSGGQNLAITLRNDGAVGEYARDAFTVSYTPDARTSSAALAAWDAGGNIGSGTVTVTTRTAERIAGSLKVTLVPRQGNPATGTLALEGSFDIPFHDRSIC